MQALRLNANSCGTQKRQLNWKDSPGTAVHRQRVTKRQKTRARSVLGKRGVGFVWWDPRAYERGRRDTRQHIRRMGNSTRLLTFRSVSLSNTSSASFKTSKSSNIFSTNISPGADFEGKFTRSFNCTKSLAVVILQVKICLLFPSAVGTVSATVVKITAENSSNAANTKIKCILSVFSPTSLRMKHKS